MKKAISLLIVLTMLALVFTGCQQKVTPTSAPVSKSEIASSSVTPTPTKDPKDFTGEITFWTAWSDEQVGPWIADFNKVYPNIKVKPVKYANKAEGNVQVNTSLLAGEKIDVLLSYSDAYLMPRIEGGLLYDITDLATRDKIDFAAEWGLDRPYKNRDYFIPYGGNNDSIYVNMKMFEKAGIKIPQTWTMKEMTDIARKLTSGTGASKVYGYSNFHGTGYWARYALGALGNDYLFKPDGTSNYDNPAFKQALQLEYDMQITEKIQYPFMEYKSTGIETPDVLLSGKTAMALSTAYLCRWLNNPTKYPRDFKVSFVPVPSLTDGKTNYNDGVFYFTYIGIGAKTKELDAAWEFSKWLARDGSAGLASVGHLPLWKKGDPDKILTQMFGKLNPADYIDVEAFKRVVLNYKDATYVDTVLTAVTECRNIGAEQMERCLTGEITVDKAISNMKELSDAAIKKAKS